MLRRTFITGSLATPFLTTPVFSHIPIMVLQNTKTGEILRFRHEYNVVDKKVIEEFNWFARDHRENVATDMDPKLLDMLHAISSKLGIDPVFAVLSGYRTEKTNRRLRKKNPESVAVNSYHVKGQALDITNYHGISPNQLAQAARSLNLGGVGAYRRFVHIDTGPRGRYW